MPRLKNNYTKEDLKEFDRLLKQTEIPYMGDYRRNIGRIDLNKWLKQFTEEAKNKMWKIVKEY